MNRKEIVNQIINVNRVITEYKKALDDLAIIDLSGEKEITVLENVYGELRNMIIEGNMLKHKIDKYLMDKKWSEEDE